MNGVRLAGYASMVGVLLASFGCGGSTETTPSPVYTQITEGYSGTLNPGETKAFHFTVTNPGSIDAAITSLSPISSLTMGLQLGSYDATTDTCPQQLFSNSARLNVVLSGTPQGPGEYCVAMYDVGNLQSATDFGITVLHY